VEDVLLIAIATLLVAGLVTAIGVSCRTPWIVEDHSPTRTDRKRPHGTADDGSATVLHPRPGRSAPDGGQPGPSIGGRSGAGETPCCNQPPTPADRRPTRGTP
jgi:hypothetical protein